MPKFYAQDYKITVGTANLSTSLASVTLDITSDEVETTAFGSAGGYRTRIGGLKDASVSLDFHQDFGAGAVDALLFPLIGSTVAVKIAPTSGTVTATNPEYQFSALVTQYQPFAGAVGDLATLSVTWPVTGEVTRATAPGA
jgi:predicted secreted protein